MRGVVPTGMKWNAVEWWNTAVHAPAFLLSPLPPSLFDSSLFPLPLLSFFLFFPPSPLRLFNGAPISRPSLCPLRFLSLLTCGTSRNLSIIIVSRARALLRLSLASSLFPRCLSLSAQFVRPYLDLLEILAVFTRLFGGIKIIENVEYRYEISSNYPFEST